MFDRRRFLTSVSAVALGVAAVPAVRARASALPAGRRVIYSYKGTQPPAELFTLASKSQVGGVIFFADNIASAQQLAEVAAELRKASPVPLMLTTDQEGGQVNRLPGGPGASAKQVGAAGNSVAAANAQAAGAAHVLAAANLDANLAPVLDVYRSAGDFLDRYQRSYSNRPEVVAGCGEAYVRTLQGSRISACAKHFPGLGAAPAGANTDERPVTITLSAQELTGVDMVPFDRAIGAGVAHVMMSWAVYSGLDANRPAGMSPIVVQNYLRQRLGFRGLVVSDALEAGALANYGSTGNRAIAADKAGVDLLCCSSRDIEQGKEAAQALR
ncbi:glycoside hydrolase family 3 N-terminal domain-containing protein [Nocardia macrotermitis]|uniref:Beta-hexosaminidase n=1 Tax=Nocardia macrotermitis TaxID=2585198 RepID=A0A7K0CYG5_9NOCA|nr:glycoside hydrolase family 3 N-terminal domain-containing protein [Nocardia macrotermitis]MQY18530.1 Beta-hexosaminidase [Nocardia macrotermitis]